MIHFVSGIIWIGNLVILLSKLLVIRAINVKLFIVFICLNKCPLAPTDKSHRHSLTIQIQTPNHWRFESELTRTTIPKSCLIKFSFIIRFILLAEWTQAITLNSQENKKRLVLLYI
jgi:hypothetical protein